MIGSQRIPSSVIYLYKDESAFFSSPSNIVLLFFGPNDCGLKQQNSVSRVSNCETYAVPSTSLTYLLIIASFSAWVSTGVVGVVGVVVAGAVFGESCSLAVCISSSSLAAGDGDGLGASGLKI
ncbi:hypothetical protein GCK72_002296 [Caenorhabditis remanei]|uniref:Uncharacterized protein n=1 Tax=Caenorhabditis remanei TaxID=31234 RepID=A0A6A5HW03_CAERE|nr:hypothetical protein GCK72_002296 [Caenorhabditis remanei]KAF1770477.1 hypothetical protein GCK72_002296 [Caenorhabditis remanei]